METSSPKTLVAEEEEAMVPLLEVLGYTVQLHVQGHSWMSII